MLYLFLKGGGAVFTHSAPDSQKSTLVAPIRSHRISSVYTGLLSVTINNMKLGNVLTGQTLAAQQVALQCSQQSEQGIEYQLLSISAPDKAPKNRKHSIHNFALEDGRRMNHSNAHKTIFLLISLSWQFLPERPEQLRCRN